MNTDLESIAHLDFDVDEAKAPKCEGSSHWEKVNLSGEIRPVKEQPCSNEAKLLCFRTCCGHAQQLCIACYNHLCQSEKDCRFCWGRDKTAKWFSQVVPL